MTILPKGATVYESDMNKIISCANCGKKLEYGESYTSRKILTPIGFGYAVCKECYKNEWEEWKKLR